MFVDTPDQLPTLIRCGLMHYQFETIHPFLDGNGRIGRLLINLMLMEEGRLGAPLLYLSGYLETRRKDYYNRLQDVREQGSIQEWLQFFLTAVRRSADDAVRRSEKLVALREQYLAEAAKTRSNLPALVDLIFTNPFLTVVRVERKTGLTNQGARNLIKDAARRGWVDEIGTLGRGGRMYWVAKDLYAIIDAPDVRKDVRKEGSPQSRSGHCWPPWLNSCGTPVRHPRLSITASVSSRRRKRTFVLVLPAASRSRADGLPAVHPERRVRDARRSLRLRSKS